jgi:hypothetical protein
MLPTNPNSQNVQNVAYMKICGLQQNYVNWVQRFHFPHDFTIHCTPHFAQKTKPPIIAMLHAQQDLTIAHPISYLRLLSISLTRTQVLLSKIGNTIV